MKVGFLSDAHGNPHGLAACLHHLERQGAARLYYLGDSVGYFPEENEVLDLLRASGAACIRGNHEAMLLGAMAVPEGRERMYRLEGARARLRAGHRAWIESWPERLEIDVAGRTFLLVHGSPDAPLTGYVYPDTDLTPFSDLGRSGVLMGHTHRPFLSRAGTVDVVNVGSCGMPRDAGNLASCALFDGSRFTIFRLPFDAQALVGRWGSGIDPAAAACLLRVPEDHLVGTLVPA